MINEPHLAEHEDTLPKLLLRNYRKHGSSQAAIREKDMGIWQTYSWTDYYGLVKHLCLAFVFMGLKPGERVSIIAENKPHAYWFELAVQAAGGVFVGVFADCTPPEVEYFVNQSESRFIVCQDQEQVDKVLVIKEKIPTVQKVIYWDPKGLWSYSDPILINMDQMLEMGKAVERDRPGSFEGCVTKTKGEDTAVFFYTSGTTGQPKAAVVKHKALIGMAKSFHAVTAYKENEDYVSFMPPAWSAEQVFGVACSLIFCLRANFPEEPETVQENIREIGPQVVLFGPRLWENIFRMIQAKIEASSWLNRLFYRAAVRIGERMADFTMFGKKPGPLFFVLGFLADLFVLRPLRDRLGLRKTRIAFTAGSAVSPSLIKFFHAIGVNIKQMYGGSEVGIITGHLDKQIKPETCGPPLPYVDIKLSDEGEIMVSTPNMFSGYFKDEQKSAQQVKDGWYYTGDFGYLDKDGHLVVMDRMTDLSNLAGGQRFSPQYCETQLRFSVCIKDAMVLARETETLIGALVNIDLDTVSQWAESKHIPYTTFADLSQKPEVVELIQKEISRINEKLPEFSRIRKFINLHKEFDPDEGEMTRTRKIRRTLAEERFKEMIDAIFGEKGQLEVMTQITYRDGRTGTTKIRVTVNTV